MDAKQPHRPVHLVRDLHHLRYAALATLVLVGVVAPVLASPASAKTPEVQLVIEPETRPGVCSEVRPCFGLLQVLLVNHGLRPLWLDSLELTARMAQSMSSDSSLHRNGWHEGSVPGGTGTRPPNSERMLYRNYWQPEGAPSSKSASPKRVPIEVAPGESWRVPETFRCHVDHGCRMTAVVHRRPGQTQRISARWPGNKEAPNPMARQQCLACQPDPSTAAQACTCETKDAGRTCHEKSECEGLCVFQRYEIVPQPPAPPCKPGLICMREPHGPLTIAAGTCSSFRAPPPVCLHVLGAKEPPSSAQVARQTCFKDPPILNLQPK